MDQDIGGGRLRIDLGAIAENYRVLSARIGPAELGAVVKANAYGLGAVQVALVLSDAGCRSFFVAHLAEALSLDSVLPRDVRLFLLNGLAPGAEAACAATRIIPVLNSIEQARDWRGAAEAAGRRLPAALQLDTGMARLGLSAEDFSSLSEDAAFASFVDLQMVMSHLACADSPSHPVNNAQLVRFEAMAAHFPKVPRSLANSGGAFLASGFRGDLVRAGIALLGGAPNAKRPTPMKPVVALEGRVIQVRSIGVGSGVGYGHEYSARRDSFIATIGVGYGDGLPRSLGNRGAAWFGGARLPIVGRVSMDSLSIDVTDLPSDALRAGDWVELIGPHQPIDALAEDAGTISYEILTSLGARYERSYIGAASVSGLVTP